MGVHAVRRAAAAGGSRWIEERGSYLLYELCAATTVLRAGCTRRTSYCARLVIVQSFPRLFKEKTAT